MALGCQAGITPHQLKPAQQWLVRSLAPGDQYDLVDEFGEMLGIRKWYGWIPDVG